MPKPNLLFARYLGGGANPTGLWQRGAAQHSSGAYGRGFNSSDGNEIDGLSEKNSQKI